MEITIRFQTPEDLKLIEPLLLMLRQSDVKVRIRGIKSKKSAIKPARPNNLSDSITEKLHGIIALPSGFDYKSALAEELVKKYVAHG